MAADAKTRPDAAEMRLMAGAGYCLIPLHRWDETRTGADGKVVQLGKAPRENGWHNRPEDSDAVIAEVEVVGINAGIRLTDDLLVVDVDPRAFPTGDDPLARLSAALGIADLRSWTPRTETGSGGMHLWMRKPPGLRVRTRLADYPGVELKTKGAQVVAPGSIHPNGKPYRLVFEEWCDDLSEPPQAPPGLIALAQRDPSGATARRDDDGVSLEPEEVAGLLRIIGDVASYEDWVSVLMACHAVSGGLAMAECQEWSWPSASETVAQKWGGFDAAGNEAGRVGWGTLKLMAAKYGGAAATELCDSLERGAAEDDFAALAPEELPDGASASGGNPVNRLIDDLNETYCCVLDGGAFHVLREEPDPIFEGRTAWTFMSREAFRHYFEDDTVTPFGSKKPISKADLWLASPKRRKYPGIVMDPEGLPHNRGKLNLWNGWAVQPAPGDWSMMRELIGGILCDGNAEAEAYVMRWIAYMLQKPWETPEVAIAFRGEEGTGKGTLGRALMRIAGQHGLTVSHSAQFTGRFNSHLRNCVFLFADEAVWPGDKAGEGILKQLVTEPVLSYEAKGRDITQGRNMVHLMLASNEEWIVPAGPEARRFFVSDVSNRRRQDQAFFGRLWRQMDGGGLAGMVHDLMAMDLTGWRPAMAVPQTEALSDQKLRSLRPAERFWFELLGAGELPFHFDESGAEVDWRKGAVEMKGGRRDEMVVQFDHFLRRNTLRAEKATHKALATAGRKFGLLTGKADSGAVRVWKLPRLDEARETFQKRMGITGLFD